MWNMVFPCSIELFNVCLRLPTQCTLLVRLRVRVLDYSQTWLESHCLQHQPLYNNTHDRNRFNSLCTKCPGYNNNLVITAHFSGTKGVVVNKFDCICAVCSVAKIGCL